MIKLVIVLACLNGVSAPQPSMRDRWFGPDKVKHFLMSAFIQSATFSAARAAKSSRSNAQVIAGVSSTVFGIGKEIYDRRRARPFSAKDLLWDGAGALTAAALLNGTR
jgi:putative lipoprotein